MVLHNWDGPGPESQWSESLGSNVEFVFQPVDDVDYVMVLNDVAREICVNCDPQRIWGFIQEPPIPEHRKLQLGRPFFARVFTTDEEIRGERYTQYWGALQWGVGLDYNALENSSYEYKEIKLAWITSNLDGLPGHKKRMEFLSKLRDRVPELELYGRGFRPTKRKWDILKKASYSIAFENFGGGIYWSEKLTDCFLSYSTPFYYGAREIDKFFPKNSFIKIDPEDKFVFDKIIEVINSRFHEEHIEELREARELCLKKYNTLAYLSSLAEEHFASSGPPNVVTRNLLRPMETESGYRRMQRRLKAKLRYGSPQWLQNAWQRIKRKN